MTVGRSCVRTESGVRLTSRHAPGESLAAGAGQPRVFLHIGEPKTGTTYLQHVVWGNQGRLADRGILLPGYTRRDHSRASRDLREAPRPDSDPADPWIGEWDVLTRQALRAPHAALISDELLVVSNASQADRAVRSLLSAELHIVLTVRDFAGLLPAEWQESVKTRRTDPWEQWLGDVVETTPDPDRRSRSWFWGAHDTLATLDMWSQHVPPDRVHVITMPRNGSTGQLWDRFASVLGVDSQGFDLSQARANPSLGLPETEFLRRMNGALQDEIPDWYYTRYIKQILAHDVLTEQARPDRLALPPGREAWVRQQSEALVAGLREAKYHLVGDLSELLPRPADDQYLAPDQQPAEQLLDVAVHAAAVLAEARYREVYLARQPRQRPASPRQLASQLKWSMLNGPRIKRALRKASHRPAVRRLRVAIWWVLVRPTRHRLAVAATGSAAGAPAPGWLAGGRPGITGVEQPGGAADVVPPPRPPAEP